MNAVLKDADPRALLARFGGLTILERQLHLLKRAGATLVRVDMPDPETNGLRLPEDLAVEWDSDTVDSVGETLVFSAKFLMRRRKLDALAADGPGVYRAENGDEVLRVEPAENAAPISIASDDSISVSDLRMSWLLKEARKDTDSFMARHFDRYISLAATRFLLDTPISPTQMTLFSCALGLSGALLLGVGSYGWTLAGALIIWAHTLFDGCDGELARLRYQESRLGGQIDFWGDNLIHFTLFTALGVGQWRATGMFPLLVLGATAGVSSLVAAWLVWRHTTARETDGGPLFKGVADVAEPSASGVRKWLARVEDTLTQRDFIYLFVFLAAIGKMGPFLLLAGIGTPLFALVFFGLQLASRARS